jgi:hypothetical protein
MLVDLLAYIPTLQHPVDILVGTFSDPDQTLLRVLAVAADLGNVYQSKICQSGMVQFDCNA